MNGAQGPQGVQGIQGIQGEGVGEPGPRGPRGYDALTARRRRALIGAFLLVTFGIFWQSYNGRRDVIANDRQVCLSVERHILVPEANSLRADAKGNQAVASDPNQPPLTRSSRAAEVVIELNSLLEFDRHLDPRVTGALNNDGKWVIRWLVRHHQAYSCTKAYGDASPVQFFN